MQVLHSRTGHICEQPIPWQWIPGNHSDLAAGAALAIKAVVAAIATPAAGATC